MELFKAHRQWAERPADQRFASLQDLYDKTLAYAQLAREKNVPYKQLRVEVNADEVQLIGKTGVPAQLTHWAFGQLCQRADAPASYLRGLPATLACQNLNYGLAEKKDDEMAALMFHDNGHLLLRSVMTPVYSRFWNYEIAERLLDLEPMGWTPAMPDIRVGLGDFPALYASDHDLFAFVRNNQNRLREPGNPNGLQRGVIAENSEVGGGSIKMTRFLYREMCGNHIIWGAERVLEIRVRHVGNVRERFADYAYELKKYADSSPSDEEAIIASAKNKVIAQTKEEVLDTLFGRRSLGISKRALDAGYDAVQPDTDGDPNTVWGLVQGLTRHSQTLPHADERTRLDKAAGRLMEFDF